MRLVDICEDGKVVVALWVAEKTLKDIVNKTEDYDYCRKSVDLCWDWLSNRKPSKVQIAERISNDNKSISRIVLETEDMEMANQYGSILICLSYIAWQAYNYEKDFYYPQDLECVNDEYLEELISELIEEVISNDHYEMVLKYIAENYNKDSKMSIKQNIIAITPK